MAAGWSRTFERAPKYMDWNLKHLKVLTRMQESVDKKSIRPCRKAMGTLDIIFTHKTAWKFAGKKFRMQLFEAFEFKYEDSLVSVPVEEAHWPAFKEEILDYHHERDPRNRPEYMNIEPLSDE